MSLKIFVRYTIKSPRREKSQQADTLLCDVILHHDGILCKPIPTKDCNLKVGLLIIKVPSHISKNYGPPLAITKLTRNEPATMLWCINSKSGVSFFSLPRRNFF